MPHALGHLGANLFRARKCVAKPKETQMSTPKKAKGQRPEAPKSQKGKQVSKRANRHESKAPESFGPVTPYTVFSREPVIMKLSPEDSKIVREAIANPVDVNKVFAKAIKMHDRMIRKK